MIVDTDSPAASRPQNLLQRLAILAILLFAFGLRAHRLDFQSLWSDEGISLQRATQPLLTMLKDMPVEHMPGYFVLLHGWVRLAGDGDYALRFLSLVAGVLAVSLIFRIAVDLASRGNETTPVPFSVHGLAGRLVGSAFVGHAPAFRFGMPRKRACTPGC